MILLVSRVRQWYAFSIHEASVMVRTASRHRPSFDTARSDAVWAGGGVP